MHIVSSSVVATAFLLAVGAPGFTADLEQFTLRDGRVLVGTYDEFNAVMTITLNKGTAKMHVDARDILTREPYTSDEDKAAIELQKQQDAQAKRVADQDEAAKRKAADAAAIQAVDEAKAAREAEKANAVAMEKAKQAARERNQHDKEAAHQKAVNRAAFWKDRGEIFDPEKMTAQEMDDAVQAKIDAAEAAEERQRQEAAAAEREKKNAEKKEADAKRGAVIALLQAAITPDPDSKREAVGCFPQNLQGEWWEIRDDGKAVDAYTVANEASRIEIQRFTTETFDHLYTVTNPQGKITSFEAFPDRMSPGARAGKYVYVLGGDKFVYEALIGPGNKVMGYRSFLIK